MALFKILRGDSSKISTEDTPFHDGYAYFTPDDGGFYIDATHSGTDSRIRINPTNAKTAESLKTGRKIDGVTFDGNDDIVHYGTCGTAAATAAKTVSLPGFVLTTGADITVKFTNANSATTPTLNVNETGAKAIKRYGTTAPATYMWQAGAVVHLVYDGANWIMDGGSTATTTYYGVTKLSSATNSTSTSLAATPSAVKAAYDLANAAIPKTQIGVTNGVAGLDANGKVPSEQIPDTTTFVEVILLASGWSNGFQAVTVNGLAANQNGVIGLSQNISNAQIAAAKEAELYIYGQSAGALTVAVGGTTPQIDIPVTIILFG